MKALKKINFFFFLIAYLLPLTFVFLGVSLVVFVVIFPYVGLKVSSVMAIPVVPSALRSSTGFAPFGFNELSREASASVVARNVPAVFSLTVPKLKISNAKVETNSTDLSPDTVLGHYKGTALPGEPGNALIYGHSVLPLFFNPRDYKTIFSTLPKLQKGDIFYIDYSGRSYEYEIVEKKILRPEEVNVFDPNPALLPQPSSTVTLFTCVPPGAKTYRMLVIGKLVAEY